MKKLTMKKLTMKQLHEVMDRAKENLVRLPARARLSGHHRPLKEGERLALAYFAAVSYVLGNMGVDTSEVLAAYQTDDVE